VTSVWTKTLFDRRRALMWWSLGLVLLAAAVISFFVICGYVMALLVAKHYPTLSTVPSFYLDRAARLSTSCRTATRT
jgi:peptidoglycan/LPS O-acetylase OafA/YrhL